MARKNRIDTRVEILQSASGMFLEKGYSKTTAAAVCRELDISTGNLTFYFPTKEHLLLELTKIYCLFQQWGINRFIDRDAHPLLVFGLTVAAQTAACEENEIARDFYVSAYTSPLPLSEIRRSCSELYHRLFARYNPDWTEENYSRTENLVSGIKLATIMTESTEAMSTDDRIADAVDACFRLFNVPKEERVAVLRAVLRMPYRDIGRRIFDGFKHYTETYYQQMLDEASGKALSASPLRFTPDEAYSSLPMSL